MKFRFCFLQCSVPCGYGNKTRKVVCKTSGIDCDTENQPAEEQECYSGKSCDDGESYRLVYICFGDY